MFNLKLFQKTLKHQSIKPEVTNQNHFNTKSEAIEYRY